MTAAWAIGCALRSIRGPYSKGDWGGVLDRIGIEPRTAQRYMRLAEHDRRQIVVYLTVDAALKALPPRRPPAEPEPEPTVEIQRSEATAALTPDSGAGRPRPRPRGRDRRGSDRSGTDRG